jgi:hypothetical protein
MNYCSEGQLVTPKELWEEVESCFAHDDGSLPGIDLHYLSSEELGSLCQKIRQQSHVVTDHPTLWDNESKSERGPSCFVALSGAIPFRGARNYSRHDRIAVHRRSRIPGHIGIGLSDGQ